MNALHEAAPGLAQKVGEVYQSVPTGQQLDLPSVVGIVVPGIEVSVGDRTLTGVTGLWVAHPNKILFEPSIGEVDYLREDRTDKVPYTLLELRAGKTPPIIEITSTERMKVDPLAELKLGGRTVEEPFQMPRLRDPAYIVVFQGDKKTVYHNAPEVVLRFSDEA